MASEAFRMPNCIKAIQISSVTNLSVATSTNPTGKPKINKKEQEREGVINLKSKTFKIDGA